MKLLKIGNITVRLLAPGESYGKNHLMTAEGYKVEFFDANALNNPLADVTDNLGYMISRYYASTIMKAPSYGITLDMNGGYVLLPDALSKVKAWLKENVPTEELVD